MVTFSINIILYWNWFVKEFEMTRHDEEWMSKVGEVKHISTVYCFLLIWH